MKAFLHDNPCYTHDIDVLIGPSGGDKWSISCESSEHQMFEWNIKSGRLFEILSSLKRNHKNVFLFHPINMSIK